MRGGFSDSGSGPVEWPEYSPDELRKFEAFLEGFREERYVRVLNMKDSYIGKTNEVHYREGISILEKIRPINMDEALVAFGACKKHMHLGKPTYAIKLNVLEYDSNGGFKRLERPNKYELFFHKYDALNTWKARRQYARKKEDAEYEAIAAIAEDMRIPESDMVAEPMELAEESGVF